MANLFTIRNLAICLLIAAMLPVSADESKENWLQFRGENRDGKSPSVNLIDNFTDNTPQKLWQHDIGSGFSTILIEGDLLYTMYLKDSTEYLAAFGNEKGDEKWSAEVGAALYNEFGDGPRSTPLITEKMIYALGSNGDLIAVSKKDGKQIWKRSFNADYESPTPRFGFSMSPILFGDLLIIEAGGKVEGEGEARKSYDNLIALNVETGEEVWKHTFEGRSSYSSPIQLDFPDGPQIMFITSGRIKSLNPADGSVIWENRVPGAIAMPVLLPGMRLFISNPDQGGCTMLQLDKAGKAPADTLWQNKFMRNHFNSSLYHNGAIYGFSNATLRCIDAETGKRLWNKRGLGKGSLVEADNKLFVLSDKGKVVVVEATSEEYKELGSFQAIEGKSWTSPTIANGKLYLRNFSQMAAFDLRKSSL